MNKVREYLNRIMQFGPLLLLLFALVFVRYVLQLNIPRTLLLLPIAAIGYVGTSTQILAACMCCIPLYTSMQYIFALSLLVLAYIIRFPKQFRLNVYIVPVLLMILWETLHIIGGGTINLKEFVGNFVPIGFCAFILCCDVRRIDYAFIIRTMAVCVVCVLGFLILKVLLSDGIGGFEAFMKLRYRLGEESRDVVIEGLEFNPNTLAYICLHSGIGLIQLIFSRKHRFSDVVLAGIVLFFGLLTLSRTFLLCFALMVVLLVWAYPIDKEKKKKLAVHLGIAFAIVALLMVITLPELMLSFLKRIVEKGPGTSRMDLFIQYFVHVFSSLQNYLFGIGLDGMYDKLMLLYGTDVPHNGIQEILVAWGMPGLLMFTGLIVAMNKRARFDVPNPKLINYLPLIMLLIKVQFGQLISSHVTLLMLAMCQLSISYDFYAPERKRTVRKPER